MKNLYYFKYICLIIYILFGAPAAAQKYNIKHLAAEEGLIQSQISSIVQDKDGSLILCAAGSGIVVYSGQTFAPFTFKDPRIKAGEIIKIVKDSKNNLWFCSANGLIRYDGKKETLYTSKDGLADDNVDFIMEDAKGIYWIGSIEGLTKYDGKFTPVKEINGTPVIKDVRSIMEEKSGALWISNGSVIQKIENNSVKTYKLNIPSPRNVIRRIFLDSHNRLWAATVSGLYYYDNNEFKKFTQNKTLSNGSILRIFETREGDLWFSVRDYGVIKWDYKTFTVFDEKNGLSSDLVFEIFQDKESNIWFGTNEGLDEYAEDAFVKYDKDTGLPENLVWSIFEDNKKNIWIITDKYGISILENGTIKKFQKQKEISATQYFAVYQDKNGVYWIASRTGLYTFDGSKIQKINNPSYFKDGGVSVICRDNEKNLWFCTFTNGVIKYDGKTFTRYTQKDGLLGGEVYYAFDDGKGNIWITTTQGISIFDGTKFRNYPQSASSIKKEVFVIKKDRWGGIWCATYGEGLYRVEIEPGKAPLLKQISTVDGLPSDNIFLIEIDNYDRMWVGTQAGLSVFSLKDFYENKEINIRNYNREDGIPHAEYNQAASLKDSRGFLWFGTNKGLIECDPSKVTTNTVEPNTMIKDIKIFFRDEDLSKYGRMVPNSNLPADLHLPYNMNHVTIEFAGISLTNPSKVKYRYILENFDKDWHQATGKNYETYSNLPPGNYTFKLLACNEDGIWNKVPVTYSFSIATPYYKTWWFYVLAVLFIVFLSSLFYRFRMRRIKALNKELEKTLNERIITEQKLQQSEKDYRGLFENAHDAIIILDPIRLTIISANKEACKMYGYDISEIIGLSFSKISRDFEKSKSNILEALENKGWGDYEINHLTKDGNLIDVEVNAAVINYKGQVAIVAIIHNITERKIIERALIEAKEQAEKSNQLKSNFLAQMSHEIRTPINTILSYTALLKSEIGNQVSEDLRESFQFIDNGGRRLIRTIDSILNMSQIQSGNQEVFPEILNIYDDILVKLHQELKQTANLKSLDFIITNKAEKDIILGDNYSLTQLFANLVDNAIKYTLSGNVSIITENRTPDTVTIYIKDTGIGISEEFLPNLFDPFSQEEVGYTRHFEGNGLGLALVKSYCDLNKGQIEVESKKGAGTTFIVTFKLAGD